MTMDVEMEDATTASGNNSSTAILASPVVVSSSAMTTIAPMATTATTTTGTTTSNSSSGDVDMGYEYCAPQIRRSSMTLLQEKERRASIKAVMADHTLSPTTKRRSIQFLMDGRRNSTSSAASVVTTALATAATTATTEALSRSGSLSSTGLVGAMTTPPPPPPNNLMVICLPCDDDITTTGGGNNGMMMMINNEQTKTAECSRPVCPHYDRKCTLIAPCCGRAFGCRICHDECPDLPPKINNGGQRYHRSASLPGSFTITTNLMMGLMGTPQPEDNHHPIDRFAISEIICRECYTRQGSKTNHCLHCAVRFGEYHCDICNLWMSAEEQPYHCHDCGFCRVGGRDNFRHCDECGMCIDVTLYESHNCKAGKYRSNCPVCQEYLFSSRGASHEMPCGHAIHWECFRQLAMHDSRCPVCKKTAESRERMMPTWNAMAAGIAMQPVPSELCRVVDLTCNDCEKGEKDRSWHFLGMQCSTCCSFNTVVDRIVLQGEEAHEFLLRQQQPAQATAVTTTTATATTGSDRATQRQRSIRRRSVF